MDKWHGMTMEDIRELEEETKRELDEERAKVKTTTQQVTMLSSYQSLYRVN